MQIHCLGTAGFHPNEHRHTSCYFLPKFGVVLDAGSGIFRIAKLLETEHLDILLSHAHLDHVMGLTFLLNVRATTPLKSVRVWGTSKTLQTVREHLFATAIFPVMPDWMTWKPIGQVPFRIPPFLVTAIPLEHPGGSVGYRLDGDPVDGNQKSLAYITDTTARPDAPYVAQIQDVDLLLHECNFNDQQIDFATLTGHSWTSAVAEVALLSRAKRIVLTHLNPVADTPADLGLHESLVKLSNCELASDHLVLTV